MERFYHKLNNSSTGSVEIYIGKRSGNQILKDLRNAEKEVIIISPYVAEEKIDLLINLKEQGVDVKLAFSSLNNRQEYFTLRKLIKQIPKVDTILITEVENKLRKLKKNIKLSKVVIGISIALGVLLFNEFMKGKMLYFLPIIKYSVLGFGFLYFNSKSKIKKLREKEIYNYDYKEIIPFKYLNKDFHTDNTFIHSKIYIIDEKIVYLGSVNFTNKGFNDNFETRIRITDKEAIRELRLFANDIFNNYNYKSNKIDWLGKKVYREHRKL